MCLAERAQTARTREMSVVVVLGKVKQLHLNLIPCLAVFVPDRNAKRVAERQEIRRAEPIRRSESR